MDKQHHLPTVRPTHWLKGSVDEFFLNPLVFLEKSKLELGPSFRFRAGLKWFCIFTAPEEIQEIFSAASNEFLVKEQNTAKILGQSVLTSDGETWKRQRKEANRYFSKDHLNSLISSLGPTIEKRLVKTVTTKEAVSINMQDFSVNLVCDLTIKLLFKSVTDGDFSELSHSVHIMTDYIRRYSSAVVKLPLWIPSKNNRTFKKAHQHFEHYFRKLNQLASESGEGNLLKHLAKDPLCSEQELYNEAMTFFLAGFETTANALFWCLYCLAHNPNAIQRIQEEIKDVDLNSFTDLEALKHLPFIKASVMEGLRLYPVAWFRSKIANSNAKIGKFDIQKGNIVWVCSYLTHRDENLWPNPDIFQPERFLNEKLIKPFSYVPFGGGKTFCIGKEMAMMELTVILAHLFKSYEFDFSATPLLQPLASITLRPNKAWIVKIRKK